MKETNASMTYPPKTLSRVLAKVRRRRPVVHAITNWVTAGEVADILQAMGARPILAYTKQEVEEVVSQADALVINLGTPDTNRVASMILAGRHANRLGKPVVFDPVGAGVSRFRNEAAQRIIKEVSFAALKGNQAEIGYLAGMGGTLRGIEAAQGPADLTEAAEILGRIIKGVVLVSGGEDLIVSKKQKAWVSNGHPLMGRTTGTGCMLAAVLGAFVAVEKDHFLAAVGAAAFFGLAGEKAAQLAKGPGTFKAALMDVAFALTPDELAAGVKIRE
jgi:hydroxyethylthiazole kinase